MLSKQKHLFKYDGTFGTNILIFTVIFSPSYYSDHYSVLVEGSACMCQLASRFKQKKKRDDFHSDVTRQPAGR